METIHKVHLSKVHVAASSLGKLQKIADRLESSITEKRWNYFYVEAEQADFEKHQILSKKVDRVEFDRFMNRCYNLAKSKVNKFKNDCLIKLQKIKNRQVIHFAPTFQNHTIRTYVAYFDLLESTPYVYEDEKGEVQRLGIRFVLTGVYDEGVKSSLRIFLTFDKQIKASVIEGRDEITYLELKKNRWITVPPPQSITLKKASIYLDVQGKHEAFVSSIKDNDKNVKGEGNIHFHMEQMAELLDQLQETDNTDSQKIAELSDEAMRHNNTAKALTNGLTNNLWYSIDNGEMYQSDFLIGLGMQHNDNLISMVSAVFGSNIAFENPYHVLMAANFGAAMIVNTKPLMEFRVRSVSDAELLKIKNDVASTQGRYDSLKALLLQMGGSLDVSGEVLDIVGMSNQIKAATAKGDKKQANKLMRELRKQLKASEKAVTAKKEAKSTEIYIVEQELQKVAQKLSKLKADYQWAKGGDMYRVVSDFKNENFAVYKECRTISADVFEKRKDLSKQQIKELMPIYAAILYADRVSGNSHDSDMQKSMLHETVGLLSGGMIERMSFVLAVVCRRIDNDTLKPLPFSYERMKEYRELFHNNLNIEIAIRAYNFFLKASGLSLMNIPMS